jgi:hypothetical protein
MQVTKRSEKEIVEHRFGRWDPNGRRSSPSYREGTSGAYLDLTASLRWDQSGTKGVSNNEKHEGIRHVLGRDDDRTRKIIRCCEAVKKQEAHLRGSEHAYRDIEWEERVEEYYIPVVHTRFLAGRGGGHSYEPMHRY